MSTTAQSRLVRPMVAVMLALLLTAVTTVRASAQNVIDACYVAKTGVLYLIDPGGTRPGDLPTACGNPDKHIQLAWVDGAGANHGLLSGLGDDDHPQYLLADGSRAMTGNLTVNGYLGIGTAPLASLTIPPSLGHEIYFPAGTSNVDISASNQFNLGTLTGHPIILKTKGLARLYVAGDGKVGIGTTTPGTLLSVADTIESTWGGFKFPDGSIQTSAAAASAPAILADGITSTTNGFAVTGTFNTGTIPATGPGTRLMWYPGKAAFRAGQTFGTEWDDAQIGTGSVAMGINNMASNATSTALGANNVASGFHSTAIGEEAVATNDYSMAMGHITRATGANSTAMGSHASTNDKLGAFVYGDASTFSSTFKKVNAAADNSFTVRASGGTIFYSNSTLTAGVELVAGASAWATVSDRNRKHLFEAVSGEDVLAKIANIPIPSWSYRAQDDSIRHIGPMAQDFYAAFRLGTSDLTITTSDISGVNMRAIQALEQRTRELDAMREQLEALRVDRASLEARLAALEAALRTRGQP